MKIARYWSFILILSFAGSVFASNPGANYKHLKHLDQVIGHWNYVGTDEEGRAVHGSETNSWIHNKNYVRVEGIWHAEGSDPVSYELIIGWDAELKKEVMNGMLSTGATFRREGYYDKKQNATVSRQTSVAADGTKNTSLCALKYGKHKDSWSGMWTESTQDGKPVGDAHIKVTRVAEKKHLPKNVIAELDRMVGVWKLTGQASKGELEGIWSLKWAPGNHCLVGDYSLSVAGENFRSSDLYAWDSMTKEFVLYSVYQGGHIEVGRTKLVEPGVHQGPYSVDIDGKKYEGSIEIRRKGDDAFLVTTTGLAEQGIDELKLRGVRIKTDNGGTDTKKRSGKKHPGKKQARSKQPARTNAKQTLQKFWDFATGTWSVDGDEPTFIFRKMPENRYLLINVDMHAIIQWDETIGKWKQTSITDVGRFDVVFDVKDGQLVGESAEQNFESEEIGSSQWKFDKVNKDRYTLSLHNVKRSGKRQPDQKYVFDRQSGAVPASEKVVTEKEFAEYCTAMQGRWHNGNELVADWVDFGKLGKSTVSYGVIAPTADGKGLSGDFYAGKGSGKWLTVWNPATQQIQILSIISDGTVWEEIRYKHDGKWRCEVTLNHPDGTKERIQSELTISKDGATHSYRGSDGANTGVYTRVAR